MLDYKRIDKQIIWYLTVFLYASFSLFNKSSLGSIILAVISGIVFLISLREVKRLFYWNKFHSYFFWFILFSFASASWAIDMQEAIVKSTTLFEILICMSVFYRYYINDENAQNDLLKAVMWGGFIIAGYSIVTVGLRGLLSIILAGERWGGGFDNTNTIGFLCSLSVIISLYFLYEKKNQPLLYLFDFFCVIVVLAGESRKAAIILLIGSLTLVLINSVIHKTFKSFFHTSIIVLGIVMLVMTVLSMDAFHGISNRMEGLFAMITGKGRVDHSALMRQIYIEIGMKTFLENPIKGIGIGCAHIVCMNESGDDNYLHNNFAELLASLGIVGFLLYYRIHLFCLSKFFKFAKRGDKTMSICLTLLLCLLFADNGAVSYYAKSTYFLFLLFFISIEKKTIEDAGDQESKSSDTTQDNDTTIQQQLLNKD